MIPADSVIDMQASKSAILALLAIRSDGRIALTGLDDQLRASAAAYGREDPVVDKLLEGIDLIEAGLVVSDGEELQITDAGREVAEVIRQYRAHPALTSEPPRTEALGLIDRLVGPDVRSRIFDLEMRGADESSAERSGEEGKERPLPTPSPVTAQRSLPDAARSPDGQARSSTPAPIELPPQGRTAPRERTSRDPAGPTVRGTLRRLGLLWRRHLEQDLPQARPTGRNAGLNGGLVALVSLLALIICAGAVIALAQIRSLKTEVSSLQRELSPLKERLARMDQAEKAREAKDAKDAKAREDADRRTAAVPQQAPLSLSREEVQLIREYIKPAPAGGPATALPSVGDPVAWPTIPFPSPVTEKVPKLLGARFTIRNGAILVVRRDSRQVDAILGPN
ncbi:hypothetical protein [Bradyrhizobium sp. DOA9]|uniref:hypothetical protein n=1 Tax=Bradyrhizobium sp. DOA9 TaxID=1126627 RepID=UPI00046A063A|nr:hypothetical protein [Bradyrhizobium sp. DOA9]GAJ37382.1 hypothetical protein BDOA9_0166020 [Bradyrhizobium sp. DOA9]